MKVKDLMTAEQIRVCSLESKLSEAAKLMKDNNKGALPVVDKEQKVIGILTDRDIALSLAAKSKTNSAPHKVKDILPKARVYSVKTSDEISDALREMRKNKVGRLPVTDHEGKLKGIISVNTILSRAVNRNEAIGQLQSKNENLAKTMKAIFDRNSTSSNGARSGKRAAVKSKAEPNTRS